MDLETKRAMMWAQEKSDDVVLGPLVIGRDPLGHFRSSEPWRYNAIGDADKEPSAMLI